MWRRAAACGSSVRAAAAAGWLVAAFVASACGDTARDGALVSAVDAGDSSDAIDTLPDVVVVADTGRDAVEVRDEPDAIDVAHETDTEPSTTCQTVCFEWVDSGSLGPVLPDSGEFGIADCNEWGLVAGLCPDGFECIDAEPRWFSSSAVREGPVCTGDASAYVLGFDLAEANTKRVPVTLLFRLGDGQWPLGAAGTAGTVVLRDRETGRRVHAPVPTVPTGRLDFDVPAGVYDVTFVASSPVDVSAFPMIPANGLLEVVAPGTANVRVPAATVDWTVRIDGDDAEFMPTGMTWMDLSASAARGSAGSVRRTEGEPLSGSWLFWPGTYDVLVRSYASDDESGAPSGSVTSVEGLELADGDHVDVVFEVFTTEISGRVTAFGEPVYRAVVEFWSAGDAVRATTDHDGRFSARVYPGVYDVYVATHGIAGLPDGRTRVAAGYSPPGELNIELDLVTVRGEVTVDGEEPADGRAGLLELVSSTASATLSLETTGPAAFEGVVFSGPYDVWVIGDGYAIPGVPQRAEAGWDASDDYTVFDVTTFPVHLEFTVDGATFVGEDGDSLGTIVIGAVNADGVPLDRAGGVLPLTTLADVYDIPRASPAAIDLQLHAGYYSVTFSGSGGSSPHGSQRVAVVEVTGPTSRVIDIETALVQVQLTFDRDEIDPALGQNRGHVFVGSASGPVRPTGPARSTHWIVRGEYDLEYQCLPADGCVESHLPLVTTLVSGIRF